MCHTEHVLSVQLVHRTLVNLQIALKSLYEVVMLPITIRVVNFVKRIDHSDVYDRDISYNIWKIKEI